MIDEKKLIEDIKECYTEEFLSEYGFHKLVESQPKVGEWIPVSEGLPKENKMSEYYEPVIVTLDNGRVVDGCYRNRDKEWWVDAEDGEHYSINATGHVIAWMPLPEPYRGDEE